MEEAREVEESESESEGATGGLGGGRRAKEGRRLR